MICESVGFAAYQGMTDLASFPTSAAALGQGTVHVPFEVPRSKQPLPFWQEEHIRTAAGRLWSDDGVV